MKLRFLGGADEIGASSTLVEIAGKRLLVDCGIRHHERGGERIPALAGIEGRLDAIILTHAHLDHSGSLPVVAQSYPNVPIYLTTPTLGIVSTLLNDALKIMQMGAVADGEVPIYTAQQIDQAFMACRPIGFDEVIKIGGDLELTFRRAGHILGAGSAFLQSSEGSIVMSGDIHALDQITVPALTIPANKPDIFVIESTYGDKRHASRALEEQRLIDRIREVVENQGTVLIPAFAVGRSQELILLVSRAIEQGKLPEVPLFIDGMVKQVCGIYNSYPQLLSPWLARRIQHRGNGFFAADFIKPIYDFKTRAEVAKVRPGVIISSSGMLTVGSPSSFYAAELAQDPRCLIAISGYQDEESPGRHLLELARKGGGTIATATGETMLQCKIEAFSFSAHSDSHQMLTELQMSAPRRIVLVHGEGNSRKKLANTLQSVGFKDIFLPNSGAELEVIGKQSRRSQVAITQKAAAPPQPNSLQTNSLQPDALQSDTTQPQCSQPDSPTNSISPLTTTTPPPIPATAISAVATPTEVAIDALEVVAVSLPTTVAQPSIESTTTSTPSTDSLTATPRKKPRKSTKIALTTTDQIAQLATPTEPQTTVVPHQAVNKLVAVDKTVDVNAVNTNLVDLNAVNVVNAAVSDAAGDDPPGDDAAISDAAGDEVTNVLTQEALLETDQEYLEFSQVTTSAPATTYVPITQPLSLEMLRVAAAKLLERDQGSRKYTAAEILSVVGYRLEEVSLGHFRASVKLLHSGKSTFSRMKGRAMYSLKLLPGKQLWQPSSKVNQAELIQTVKEAIKDEELQKIGLKEDEQQIVLRFLFPAAAIKRHAEVLQQLEATTHWKVIVYDQPHQEALMALAKQLAPADWVIDNIAVHLDKQEVTAKLQLQSTLESAKLAPQHQSLKITALAQQFVDKTGFKLTLKLIASTALARTATTPDMVAIPKLEINAALAVTKKGFQDQPHELFKAGLKNGQIELTFITPEIGHQYQSLLTELSNKTGYAFTIRPTPDQIRVQEIARQVFLPDLALKAVPSIRLDQKQAVVKVSLSTPQTLAQTARQKFNDQTAWELVVLIEK
jgi:predicted metal-dependent RNase